MCLPFQNLVGMRKKIVMTISAVINPVLHESFLEKLLVMVSGTKSSAIWLINYSKGC